MLRRLRHAAGFLLLTLAFAPMLAAQEPAPPLDNPGGAQGLNGLKEIPFHALSSTSMTPLATAAFSIRPTEWKHAETDNFIYHYFHDFIATPVSVEAEFYYRVVAKDLNKDTTHWERKANIYVFETPQDWGAFRTRGGLEQWTGGLHSRGELFIQRDPTYKFKNNTLGHEITHLVVDRFYGSNIPLWLNEGYAEYISRVAYASYYRARGYTAKPRTDALTTASFVPLDRLTQAVTYPTDVNEVVAFYTESEKLVRFLNAADKTKFLVLMDALARGSLFENALHTAYGTTYPSPAQLEAAFRPYAVTPSVEGAETAAVKLRP